MNNKHKKVKRKNVFLKILQTGIFIMLAIGAIKIGTIGGDMLSRSNINLARNVDTETLKMTLNYSLPVINMIYNSGHISVSLSNEIKKAINGLFSFDLDSPLTILNAQSPMLYSYYYNSFQSKQMAIGNESGEVNQVIIPDDIISRGDAGDLRQDALIEENINITDSSSISMVQEEEPVEKTQDDNTEEEKVTSSGKILIQQVEGTKYKLDIEALLKEPLKINFDKKGPKALIYHTHTTEAYLKNINELNSNVPERTTDERYNVVKVGDELDKQLKLFGITSIHNGTNHIEKTDVGCYERSLQTMTSIINGNPSIKLTFDIHRDGIGNGKKLRPVTNINGKSVAQIMFVVGTDANKNLWNPNWKENLKLALKLQKYLEDHYPGITKPIYISKNRYNLHATTGSLIIEAGGDGNTIDEAVESMKYVAKAISEVIK